MKLASYQHLRKRVSCDLSKKGEIRRIGSVESSSVNVRLICATHRNLLELENTDAFRRDLFHRINVLRLELPPLRERGDDIQGLTNWLIKRVSSRLECEEKPLSEEARNALVAHDWPGNVRELEHTIERALVMSEGRELSVDDLSLPIKSIKQSALNSDTASTSRKRNTRYCESTAYRCGQ